MVNWRNTRLPKLEGESEVTSVFEMVINHTYELGFQYCSFTMSTQLPNHQMKPIQFNNYPNEWNNLYKQAHFFDVDPVVAHCKRCVLPIVWEEKVFSDAPNLWDLAQSFGVHQGWSQSVHDFQGVFSMLTLGRNTGEVSPEELYEKAGQVLWLCHAMHAVVAQKFCRRTRRQPTDQIDRPRNGNPQMVCHGQNRRRHRHNPVPFGAHRGLSHQQYVQETWGQ